MIEELRAINRNNRWELINLRVNKKAIDVKWNYKLKLKPNGDIAKHKAKVSFLRFYVESWT
jgi:hypothetical protein